MRKSLRVVAVLVFVSCMFSFVGTVYGAWSETYSSGGWDTHTSVKAEDLTYDNSDLLSTWAYGSVSNFTQYSADIVLGSWTAGGAWDIATLEAYLNITLVGANGKSIRVDTWYDMRLRILGIQKVETHFKTDFYNGAWHDNVIPMAVQVDYDTSFWLYRPATDKVTVKFAWRSSWYEDKAQHLDTWEYTVGSDWFSSVSIYQEWHKHVYNGMQGTFSIEKLNEHIYTGGGSISDPSAVREMTLAEQMGASLSNALGSMSAWIYSQLPESVRNILDAINGILSQVWNLFSTLFTLVLSNWYILVGAYGLYLLGLIFKCIDAREFAPLFDHFRDMAGVVTGIGSTLIQVADTVKNFIQWW